MRFIELKELPPSIRGSHLDFKMLLGKLRRDKWLELSIAEYRHLTGSKAKQFAGSLPMKGIKQKVVSCLRTVDKQSVMYIRLY